MSGNFGIPKKPITDRFWSKVEIRKDDECWYWQAGKNHGGYGQFKYKGKTVPAHRVAWILEHDRNFPEGKYACHTCDTPSCVNPKHIWPGTQAENMQDAVSKGRKKKGDLCKRGHPLLGENLVPNKRGYRICRQCHRIANERTRRRKGVPVRLKPSCIKGHIYTEDNTYYAADGSRSCRTCKRDFARKYYSQRTGK